VSTTLKYQRYADAQDAAVTVEEAKPPRFRGDRDEPKVAITLSLNEADALLTGSEAAAIRAINNSRVAHRRYDDFSLAAAELRSAAKILERVGEIAQQVDDATRGERY
jgi:ATP/maltotriose-dependent transcriptional regulator MalT